MKTLKEQLTREQWAEFEREVKRYHSYDETGVIAYGIIDCATISWNAKRDLAKSFKWKESWRGRDYWEKIYNSLEE